MANKLNFNDFILQEIKELLSEYKWGEPEGYEYGQEPDWWKGQLAAEDQVPGGVADKLSIQDLADKHNVSVDNIKSELKVGLKIELEHTDDKALAWEIAKDHVAEFPDYYTNPKYGTLASEKGLKNESQSTWQHTLLKKGNKIVITKAKDIDSANQQVLKKYPNSDPMLTHKDGKEINWDTGPITESVFQYMLLDRDKKIVKINARDGKDAIKQLDSKYPDSTPLLTHLDGKPVKKTNARIKVDRHLEEPAIIQSKKDKKFYLASVDSKTKLVQEVHRQSRSNTADDICRMNWVQMYKKIHENRLTEGQSSNYKYVSNPIQSCRVKRENVNEEVLTEGVYDPNILKAVFLAGGPGSGKSYTVHQVFGVPEDITRGTTALGLKVINSDAAFEKNLKDKGVDPKNLNKMTDKVFKYYTMGDKSARDKAKVATKKLQAIFEKGRLGMIIDGTGHDYAKIDKMKKRLESMGYDTHMLFVNTGLDVALERNKTRDRVLPDELVTQSWKDVQNNLGKFQSLFGNSFHILDNSEIGDFTQMHRQKINAVTKMINQPVKNPIGKKWIENQKKLRNITK